MSESLTKRIRKEIDKEVRKRVQGVVADTTVSMTNRLICFDRRTRLKLCWWLLWMKPKRILFHLLNTPIVRDVDLINLNPPESNAVKLSDLNLGVKK